MKKILLISTIAVLAFYGCTENAGEQDEKVAVISSISVSDNGVIYNDKVATITATIENNGNTVSSVEFFIDGELRKTIFAEPYQYQDTFKDWNTGEHEINIVANCADGKNAQKNSKATFKVSLGDNYQGGIVIASKDGLSGVIAATSDLNSGSVGRYSYGAYNGNYAAYSMEDGLANTNKFSGKFDGGYAAIACLNFEQSGKNDWYLPAYNEMALFEQFLEQLNIPVRSGWIYWSSTGDESNTQRAYAYPFGVSFGTPCDMQGLYRVRCCRRF